MSDHPWSLYIWTSLASLAGSLTALSVRPFETMSRWQIILSVVAGTSFAIFVGPWAVWMIFKNEPIDFRLMGGVFYVLATGSNVLIPLLVKKLANFFGEKDVTP